MCPSVWREGILSAAHMYQDQYTLTDVSLHLGFNPIHTLRPLRLCCYCVVADSSPNGRDCPLRLFLTLLPNVRVLVLRSAFSLCHRHSLFLTLLN